jgi:hypothetical protein
LRGHWNEKIIGSYILRFDGDFRCADQRRPELRFVDKITGAGWLRKAEVEKGLLPIETRHQVRRT